MLVSGFGFTGTAFGAAEFTVEKTGMFYHILSDSAGAYDLAADKMRTTSEPDSLKDFVNTDSVGFTGKWKAGNATTFVNAPGYPTFNAQGGSPDFTVAKIDSLYKAGTPVTFNDNPGTGSHHVWIAKLRGGDEYVIVKFVTRLGNSSGTSGSTTFQYWKRPSTTGEPTVIRSMVSADKKSIRLKSYVGQYEIGLDGKSTGVKVLNLLGQAMPEARLPQQNYIVPIAK
ncbi:MAG: hypothetical protein JWP91_4056 [Fibrobacteres bacterium]|nr:hypothetical protein [Fibrobacterota bacterium]